MQYSSNGMALTESFEAAGGPVLKAYQDQKSVWTIGFGHTQGVHAGMTCTVAQAVAWLAQDVAVAVAAVNRLVTVVLNQNQFDALVDFVFNLGAGNFATSSLLKYVNADAFYAASAEFPKWNHCAGQVNDGLTRRCLARQKLFNTPV